MVCTYEPNRVIVRPGFNTIVEVSNQTMSASYGHVASGLATVTAATTPVGAVAQSAECWYPLGIRGPYDGADPGDRFIVGDVARFSDGVDGTKQYINFVKMQGAYDALRRAGVEMPTIIGAKRPNAQPVAGVMVSAPNGTYSGGVYQSLPFDKSSPHTGVFYSGTNYQTGITPGTVVSVFPNGTSVVDYTNRSLLSQPGMAMSQMTPAVRAANANTSGIVPSAQIPEAGSAYLDIAPGLVLVNPAGSGPIGGMAVAKPSTETVSCATCKAWS
jgi:hypothetical protein